MKTTGQLKPLTLKPFLYLELLIASLLPVSAILLVMVVGAHQIANGNPGFFLLISILCAIATFFGEGVLILFTQQAIKEQLADLLNVCQDVVAGDKGRRAIPLGDSELTDLVKAVNTLLDHVHDVPQSASGELQSGVSLLNVQVQHLFDELHPVSQGNLSVRASLSEGNVGLVADICNTLIEELTHTTRLIRHVSDQVAMVSRNLVDRSIEFAQTTEQQMLNISRMIEGVEQLVALAQGAGALRTVGEMAVQAESLTQDLYTLAQRLHLSSTAVLNATQPISALIRLSEEWKGSTDHLLLPEATS